MLSVGGFGALALFIRMEYARDLNNLLDEMFCANCARDLRCTFVRVFKHRAICETGAYFSSLSLSLSLPLYMKFDKCPKFK